VQQESAIGKVLEYREGLRFPEFEGASGERRKLEEDPSKATKGMRVAARCAIAKKASQKRGSLGRGE